MILQFDEQGLRVFAEAVVTAQRAIEVELATNPNTAGSGFAGAIWEYKWGLVVSRALGTMPL